jgi:pyruvate dehydrogenase E2 component (dihydrolipoamide acetyltransferase)
LREHLLSEHFKIIPMTPIRKVIAARMLEAKRTIPHFRISADIEVDALLDLREELRERNAKAHLSLNDLLIKACATALMDTPAINVQWVDGEIHQYRSADISVVTALEGGGLSTPIVQRADSKSIWDISREVTELTARAKNNALKMHEVFGGSFSVSNLGMYGVDYFDAIINAPQCAILAVGAAKLRPVISAERETRIASVIRMTLSADHRAIDGASAATFLSALRQRVEHPQTLGSGRKD